MSASADIPSFGSMNMGRVLGRVEVIGAVPRDRLSSGHRAHRFTALLPSRPALCKAVQAGLHTADDSVKLQFMARQERLLTLKAGSNAPSGNIGSGLTLPQACSGLLSKTAVSTTGLVLSPR
jgi:hypothetical protein